MGLLSYSTYLWHQPIFALARIRFGVEAGSIAFFVLGIISVCLAWFSWMFVEKPFRFSMSRRKFLILLFVAAFGLMFFSVSELVQKQYGWSRFQPIIYSRSLIDVEKEQALSWNKFLKSKDNKEELGSFSHEPSIKFLIMGDSHAKDMFNALYPFFDNELSEVRRVNLVSGCTKRINDRFNATSVDECFGLLDKQAGSLLADADIVLLTRRWVIDTTFEDYLPQLFEFLKARDKTVVLAGNTVEYQPDVPVILESLHKYDLLSPDTASMRLFHARDSRVERVNSKLRNITEKSGVQFLDKSEYICDIASQRCDALSSEGDALYFDYGHYTVAGAYYFGEKIRDSSWLKAIFAQ
jgi:hypothetical protein